MIIFHPEPMQTYTVHIKPNSKKGPLVEQNAVGELTVYVRQRPVEGEANKALVELLARHFGVAKTSVQIVRGKTARTKIVRIIAK